MTPDWLVTYLPGLELLSSALASPTFVQGDRFSPSRGMACSNPSHTLKRQFVVVIWSFNIFRWHPWSVICTDSFLPESLPNSMSWIISVAWSPNSGTANSRKPLLPLLTQQITYLILFIGGVEPLISSFFCWIFRIRITSYWSWPSHSRILSWCVRVRDWVSALQLWELGDCWLKENNHFRAN